MTSRFDADIRLLTLSAEDWGLYDGMTGAGLAAHNLTVSTQAALDKMVSWVAAGHGVVTAAKMAFRQVQGAMATYEAVGATEPDARGVLITILDEYARRRFEANTDLYWDLEEEEETT